MLKSIFVIVFLFMSHIAFSQTVASVSGVKISKSEFEKSYKKAVQNSSSLSGKPSKAQHLEDMVRFKLGLIEAEKTNLRKNPEVKRALDLELYKGLLETRLSKEVNRIKVTDSEMRSYYKKNPQMRSSHIFIKLPENPTAKQTAEAKKRADKIYSQIVTNKRKWSVNVRAFTDDTATKATGGDLGYQSKTSLYPTYYKALRPLKMGEVSAPTRGLYGFHIIKKTGQHSYEMYNKNTTKIALFNQKRFKILDRYFAKLKEKYKVSYNKDLL